MRILTTLLLLSSLALFSCGDDTPASKPVASGPAPIDNSMFDTTKPKTKPTFRIIATGLDPRAAEALAAGVLASSAKHHNSFVALITPTSDEITDADPVDAIILVEGVKVPKFTSKNSSISPIIFLRFDSAAIQTQPAGLANTFTISTPVADKPLTLALTPEILADLKSGKLPSISVPNYLALGTAAAEAARTVISSEGKDPIPTTSVPPLAITKENLEDPAVKALLSTP